jgi:hypothetical protein
MQQLAGRSKTPVKPLILIGPLSTVVSLQSHYNSHTKVEEVE